MKHNDLFLIKMLLIISVLLAQFGCAFKPVGTKADYEPAKPVEYHSAKQDTGSIYQVGMAVGLFDRVTAKEVGDIVTIVLKENSNASSSSNTNATKDQKVDMPGPTIAGQQVTNDQGVEVLENKIDAGREFNGQGTSAKSSSLSGFISVTVSDVLSNGNLVVIGQKLVLINQSDEFIRFAGIIRPQDIRPDNTVESHRVADVKVAYSGDGALEAANNMGPLARFFQSGVWPY